MKVKQKNIFVREDCLDISEHGIHLRLTAIRHRLVIEATYRDGTRDFKEITVGQLARALNESFFHLEPRQ